MYLINLSASVANSVLQKTTHKPKRTVEYITIRCIAISTYTSMLLIQNLKCHSDLADIELSKAPGLLRNLMYL